MMQVKVDASEVIKALDVFEKNMSPEIKKEMDKVSDKIIREAQTNHRFKSRTGNLVQSTMKELGIDKGSVRALYKIDDVRAPYGKYVHDGQRAWSSDAFLENAVERNEKNLEVAAEKGIDNAIKKAGF
jgi:hypothetical protein